MKKNEIKSDLIHDKIISSANFITNNPKQFWLYIGGIFVLLLIFVFFSNKNESQRLLYNSYSSNNQNNYIDGNQELSIIGFDNILNDYSKSESYNQAFIYSLSNALDNNNFDKIISLIDNNKFSSKDETMNFLYNYMLGNYYYNLDALDEAERYYKSSIDYSVIELYQVNAKCALINLYLKQDDLSAANKVINSINIDELSYQSKIKIESIKSSLEYISK